IDPRRVKDGSPRQKRCANIGGTNYVSPYPAGLRESDCDLDDWDFEHRLGGRDARHHADRDQGRRHLPFSGPASSIGQVGQGVLAYVKSINDRGGINGRKINYIALDDAYSPPKSFEHARRLVENDEIAFMFSQLGTAGNSAVAKYLAGKKVSTIAIVTGASKFSNVKDYPLTTTGLVS